MDDAAAPGGGAPGWRVVGAGPVALACALFLARRGVPASGIALEPAPVAGEPVPAALASRTLALSHGTAQLLGRIASLPPAGRIERVEVSMRGHAGRTRIVATDLGVPVLGHVLRYGALLEALRAATLPLPWARAGEGTAASFTIHAEGDAGDDAAVRDSGQWALLGEVHAPRAPEALRHTAFERFTPEGPLALLPLAEPGRWSMVWCDQAAAAQARRDAAPAALAGELAGRFGDALGPLEVHGPLACAPLVRRARRRTTTADAAWIGNAAQALHPVAGQGLNLGVRDAFELADRLARVWRTGGAPAQAAADWARGRRTDRSLTIALTDLMAESFTWPLARPVQSPVLVALDLLPALRRPLAEQLLFGWR